jgi:hypothetical protein
MAGLADDVRYLKHRFAGSRRNAESLLMKE